MYDGKPCKGGGGAGALKHQKRVQIVWALGGKCPRCKHKGNGAISSGQARWDGCFKGLGSDMPGGKLCRLG